MKLVRVLGLPLCFGAAMVVAGLVGMGVTADRAEAQATSLDQVLQAVRNQRRQVSQENQQRERAFRQEQARQQGLLQEAGAQVTAEEAISDQLDATFNENEEELARLEALLREKQGAFGELFGAARQAAGETRAVVNNSMVSAQFPGRDGLLTEIASSRTLPTIEQLENLMFTMLKEMVEQGKVVRFNAPIIAGDGTSVTQEVVRIGPFVAFEGRKYLKYSPESQSLEYLQRQPAGDAPGAAGRVFGFQGEGFTQGVIDPSMGTLLGLLVQSPSLRERVDQGGTVGYVILGIAAFGVVLGVYKWVTLNLTQVAVRGQMRSKRAGKGNPLGRVMLAYDENRSADVETLSLKLDDAILREIPKLEGGLNTVKVLAAVAPLLGLLGTVTGMIQTFQAITLFGTGDPKLMAGGISQALVTTVLGLTAAIPLLLLHSFAAASSRRTSQILEEQAAGMIAEQAEAR
ncbi:MAG: MotA/TolQ/ExbB proton channel family protein [Pseudomonadota bacterium]